MVLKPIGEINAFGKSGLDEPFHIRRARGLYYYVPAKQAERMVKLNEKYNEFKARGRKSGPPPIGEVKIIGRGGTPGIKPFLIRDRRERCVCVLADHVECFRKINEECRDIAKRQRAAKKAAKTRKTKRKSG